MKNFGQWNRQKETTEIKNRVFFHPREIWFCRLGENIGVEQCGKGNHYLRPVVILKKFNKSMFLAIPLSTQIKTGKFFFEIPNSGGKKAIALLSQLKLMDGKRLTKKIGILDKTIYVELKKAITDIIIKDDDY